MSRLYEYMRLSSDDDIAKFRALSFRLVKRDTGYRALLQSIDEDSASRILEIQTDLNKELSKKYNGTYKFDLCMDEGDTLDILKIKRKYTKSLSLLCHGSNDKLSKIKRSIEEKMSGQTVK